MIGVLLCALAGGCLPSAQTQFEEEKESHYLAGKSCMNSLDYGGAIEAFAKAVEVNPRSASAHFQLGMLYEERERDPAAAIYHYERYLKLRADPEKVEWIKQRVANCKQDLAKTLLLPVPPGMQHEFEKLAEENKRLREENERLKSEATNRPPAALAGAPASFQRTPSSPDNPVSRPTPLRDARAAAAPARTHVVQPGETPAAIARKYGVRLEVLLGANPGLDPRRMRVGKILTIPPA